MCGANPFAPEGMVDGKELQVAQAIIEHTNGGLDFWPCKVKEGDAVEPLKALAQSLVCYHPKKRPKAQDVKGHDALKSVEWKALEAGQMDSPLHKAAANMLHLGLTASDEKGELRSPGYMPPSGDSEWCADF
jgi:hypothetical protein